MGPVKGLEFVFLAGGAVAFAAGTVAAAGTIRTGSPRYLGWGRAAALLGTALCTAALAASAGRGGPLPAGTTAQALALLSAAASAAALVLDLRKAMPILLAATLPLALLSSLLALVLALAPVAPSPAPPGWGMALHVAVALAAYAAFALAFSSGLVFLLVQHQLKRRAAPPFLGLMPALETVRRVNVRAIAAGVILLGAGLVAGYLTARELYPGQRQWRLDPKVFLTTVTVLAYATILVLSRRPSFKGRRTALASVAGFALVLATIGASILGSGFHRF